ncbi:MAG: protoheme IX farnesyltransferase [Anaerolineae bacterium]|nr:protoheme IX farnesyltransferase [Anaerolineae bacterium]
MIDESARSVHPVAVDAARNWRARIGKYVEVTKPSTVALLVVTCVGAMVAAGGVGALSLAEWAVALVAITAGCAAADTLTCYIDRDIDALMDRTKGRPLPGKRIDPPEKALAWGLFLGMLSMGLSLVFNPLAALWMFLGLFDNVVIYSLLAKRRSCTNILLGSISGGMPALFGWAVVQGNVTWTPVLISLLVITWTPNHIWNLAIRYREDYARANVPMLPVVTNLRRAVYLIAGSVVLMVAESLVLGVVGDFGPIYFALAIAGGLVSLVGHMYLVLQPTERNAWLMFKLSSLYLALIFAGIVIDKLL